MEIGMCKGAFVGGIYKVMTRLKGTHLFFVKLVDLSQRAWVEWALLLGLGLSYVLCTCPWAITPKLRKLVGARHVLYMLQLEWARGAVRVQFLLDHHHWVQLSRITSSYDRPGTGICGNLHNTLLGRRILLFKSGCATYHVKAAE